MRVFNYFSLIVMATAGLATWSTVFAAPLQVHVLENLSAPEKAKAMKILKDKGFVISQKPIFEEFKHTMIITKTVKTEADEPSVQIEIVKQEHANSIPKTTYIVRFPDSKIDSAMMAFPNSAQLSESKTMPVAFQN